MTGTTRSTRRPGLLRLIWAARTCPCGRRPIPPGFQPYRNSHFQFDEWEEAGYDRAFIEDYLGSNADSYNHPNAAIEPRIPGIFQYYSVAEDELAKGYAGQYGSAQETADAIAAAGRRSPIRSVETARSRSTRPRLGCRFSSQFRTKEFGRGTGRALSLRHAPDRMSNSAPKVPARMYSFLDKWCPGEDSNLHVHTDTST